MEKNSFKQLKRATFSQARVACFWFKKASDQVSQKKSI
jgi:hypothetical protein